jgi:hypothetical protein
MSGLIGEHISALTPAPKTLDIGQVNRPQTAVHQSIAVKE